MGLFRSAIDKIRHGLDKTRQVFVGGLRQLLQGKRLSDDLIDELENRLITADVGVQTTMALIEQIRSAWQAGELEEGEQVLAYLKSHLADFWPAEDRQIHFAQAGPTVILVAGINGAGKTTSIAKLAKAMQDDGKTVLLAAGDTFRAAAVEQLQVWADRLGVEIVKGKQGGDPAAVVFDACAAAKARGVDVLLVDTAGRLHTQTPLMNQLSKIRSVCQRQLPDAPHETILVLDATTGQNAINQARQFKDAIEVSGIFLSKLDGTAKGGIVVAIREQLGIPVKFIGVGETPEDVEPFEPETFIDAMFG